jgi:MoxR-like ATPase
MGLTESQLAVLRHLNATFGASVTRGQLMDHYKKSAGNGILPRWLMTDAFKVGRAVFSTVADENTKLDPRKPFPKFSKKATAHNLPASISTVAEPSEAVTMEQHMSEVANAQVIPLVRPAAKIQLGSTNTESLVPERHPTFVPFGNYDAVNKVIKSRMFYPVFITGLSGNGKTLMVEQACAANHRECIRVQITPETDEDDLIGGFRLINGETVWFDGPVVVAAMRGAICLIDEIDYGTGKISCLQGILEGKGIFLKKVNRTVAITPGFNIIATANTKGRGSEENGGRFINTNIMNEAFLERFSICLEQEFPTAKTEQKILERELEALQLTDEAFAKSLTMWAEVIRRSFENGACEDIISTRRLVHIIRTYGIFRDKKDAVAKCVSRFDRETRDGFIQLYDKVVTDDPTTNIATPAVEARVDENGEVEIDF